jgi:hypothetical protein
MRDELTGWDKPAMTDGKRFNMTGIRAGLLEFPG